MAAVSVVVVLVTAMLVVAINLRERSPKPPSATSAISVALSEQADRAVQAARPGAHQPRRIPRRPRA
jgi:hypothetical protein